MEHIYHHTFHLLKQVVDNKVFFYCQNVQLKKFPVF